MYVQMFVPSRFVRHSGCLGLRGLRKAYCPRVLNPDEAQAIQSEAHTNSSCFKGFALSNSAACTGLSLSQEASRFPEPSAQSPNCLFQAARAASWPSVAGNQSPPRHVLGHDPYGV